MQHGTMDSDNSDVYNICFYIFKQLLRRGERRRKKEGKKKEALEGRKKEGRFWLFHQLLIVLFIGCFLLLAVSL